MDSFNWYAIAVYFKDCHDGIVAIAPNYLYPGMRFAGSNRLWVEMATKCCDVINIMSHHARVTWLSLSGHAVDRLLMVTESSFGALDRGPFAQREYVAIEGRNPAIVGTNRFLFLEQPRAGRFDTKNHLTGFVDCAAPMRRPSLRAGR